MKSVHNLYSPFLFLSFLLSFFSLLCVSGIDQRFDREEEEETSCGDGCICILQRSSMSSVDFTFISREYLILVVCIVFSSFVFSLSFWKQKIKEAQLLLILARVRVETQWKKLDVLGWREGEKSFSFVFVRTIDRCTERQVSGPNWVVLQLLLQPFDERKTKS